MNCPHCHKPINAAAMLGGISTVKKAKAARLNAKKGGWPKGVPREVFQVTCPKCSWSGKFCGDPKRSLDRVRLAHDAARHGGCSGELVITPVGPKGKKRKKQ